MAKRTDIKKVLIIGSGPIVIGQAAEFDYAGTQACLALKEEGYEVILCNSNPATIMTDTSIADKVYMEPLTLEYIAKILRYERPDAIVPGIGGQTGLNLAMELEKQGVLDLEEDTAAALGITFSRPLTVRALLSHTSGIVDTDGHGEPLDKVLARTQFCDAPFRYSNLGAGIVGSFLEVKTGKSIETIVREQVLAPCGANGSFSVWGQAADCRRVLPGGWKSFQPGDISSPDPLRHYEYGAGSLFMTVGDLSRVTLSLMKDNALLSRMRELHVPYGVSGFWHGLGLLQVEDPTLYPRPLYGHQGFAYGAVNGVFFDPETGDGIISLNCGASEARTGRMAVLNRGLICAGMGGRP